MSRRAGLAVPRPHGGSVSVLPRVNDRGAAYLLIGLTTVVLLALALGLQRFTDFYSVDGDVKYLAALAISHHPFNPSIPYPAAHFDPAGHYSLPLTGWYHGHDYAGYSLLFEYLAGFSLALFGSAGLVLPSIVATVAILFIQFELAKMIGLRSCRLLSIVVTVAATPLLFYAISFWEHSWGVALFSPASSCSSRQHLLTRREAHCGVYLSEHCSLRQVSCDATFSYRLPWR